MLRQLLIATLLVGYLKAQDALLAPNEPFVIKHYHSEAYSTTYLLEIDPASYPKNPKYIHSRYSSS